MRKTNARKKKEKKNKLLLSRERKYQNNSAQTNTETQEIETQAEDKEQNIDLTPMLHEPSTATSSACVLKAINLFNASFFFGIHKIDGLLKFFPAFLKISFTQSISLPTSPKVLLCSLISSPNFDRESLLKIFL